MQPPAELLTQEEAAARAGVCARTIRRWWRRGDLTRHEEDGRLRIDAAELDAWVAQKKKWARPGRAPLEADPFVSAVKVRKSERARWSDACSKEGVSHRHAFIKALERLEQGSGPPAPDPSTEVVYATAGLYLSELLRLIDGESIDVWRRVKDQHKTPDDALDVDVALLEHASSRFSLRVAVCAYRRTGEVHPKSGIGPLRIDRLKQVELVGLYKIAAKGWTEERLEKEAAQRESPRERLVRLVRALRPGNGAA